jgi:acetyl esterase/lipase
MKMNRGTTIGLILLTVILGLIMAADASARSLRKGAPPGPHEDFGARAEIVIKDVPYVPDLPNTKKLMLDIYSNPHEGLWPAVVMIHGGGWMEGDKSMDNKVYVSKVVAAGGYVVFSINYRLLPNAKLKKQTEDCMAAVIWVKQHAKEYGADPERVGVMGGSAGGHLGALVAWASDDPYFIPTHVTDSTYDSDVKAAALYYPVLDLERTARDEGKGLGGLLKAVLVNAPVKRNIKHFSPKYHVDKNCPPTLFLTGDADNLNLYPQSVDFTKRLESLGVPTKLYTAPGKSHGFTWNYWEPESVQSAKEIVEFFDKYLK